ncbi:MarR family winged helix-turn-helix transcriptional regulator [Glaciibacter superstes]|uniref:MarR family winged helix-turn-helix transcriptional regulator n=1 Tax=Glaciibacter superstes TaxID=501023 RepID=UPI0003B402D9|nr:MarR family transcriptional regulator [Glaciibacter superstes]
MRSHLRLANKAWEAYYRAHATLTREFADADIWNGVDTSEYTVLPVLSTNPRGVSITELGRNLLLSQPSVSRLVARMESRGLLRRGEDSADGRIWRIHLTDIGRDVQQCVGRNVARRVDHAMARSLDVAQMVALRDLSEALLTGASGSADASPTSRERAGR